MKGRYLYGQAGNHMMLLACLFLSGTFIFGRSSVASFSTMDLIFLRFLIASVFMFFIVSFKGLSLGVDKNLLGKLFLSSFLGITAYHWLLFKAMEKTTALNNSLISATTPIITLIISRVIFKERLSRRKLVGMTMSLWGVVVIVSGGKPSEILDFSVNSGDIYMLGGVCLLALYFNISRGILQDEDPLKVTFYMFFLCVLMLLPFFFSSSLDRLRGVSLKVWMSLFYMGIFVSVGALLIQQISIKRIGPAKTALYLNFIPVFSLILSLIFQAEKVHLYYILSLIMILTGVWITLRGDGREEVGRGRREDKACFSSR